ncbi:MAG: hypothetical protein AAFY98_00355 [Verrucomicrobiota bacterium]
MKSKFLILFILSGFLGLSPAKSEETESSSEKDITFEAALFTGTWKTVYIYGDLEGEGTWELRPDGTGTIKEVVRRRQMGASNPRDHPLRNGVGRERELTSEVQWGVVQKFLVIKRVSSDTKGLTKLNHALIPLELGTDQCLFQDKGNPKSRLSMTRVSMDRKE